MSSLGRVVKVSLIGDSSGDIIQHLSQESSYVGNKYNATVKIGNQLISHILRIPSRFSQTNGRPFRPDVYVICADISNSKSIQEAEECLKELEECKRYLNNIKVVLASTSYRHAHDYKANTEKLYVLSKKYNVPLVHTDYKEELGRNALFQVINGLKPPIDPREEFFKSHGKKDRDIIQKAIKTGDVNIFKKNLPISFILPYLCEFNLDDYNIKNAKNAYAKNAYAKNAYAKERTLKKALLEIPQISNLLKKKNSNGQTLIIQAIIGRNIPVSRAFIACAKPDALNTPNTQDKHKTALHYAAELGDGSLFSRLISRGAKINVIDSNGNTPLDILIKNKHFDIASSMIGKQQIYNIKFLHYYELLNYNFEKVHKFRKLSTIKEQVKSNNFTYTMLKENLAKNSQQKYLLINEKFEMAYKDLKQVLKWSIEDYLDSVSLKYVDANDFDEFLKEYKATLKNTTITSNVELHNFIISTLKTYLVYRTKSVITDTEENSESNEFYDKDIEKLRAYQIDKGSINEFIDRRLLEVAEENENKDNFVKVNTTLLLKELSVDEVVIEGEVTALPMNLIESNKYLCDFENGEFYQLWNWLESNKRLFIKNNNHFLQLIESQYQEIDNILSNTSLTVNYLYNLTKGYRTAKFKDAFSFFISKQFLVGEDNGLGDLRNFLQKYSKEGSHYKIPCKELLNLVKKRKLYLDKHPEYNYANHPNSLTNRAYLVLIFLLARQGYAIEDMMPNPLTDVGTKFSDFSEVTSFNQLIFIPRKKLPHTTTTSINAQLTQEAEMGMTTCLVFTAQEIMQAFKDKRKFVYPSNPEIEFSTDQLEVILSHPQMAKEIKEAFLYFENQTPSKLSQDQIKILDKVEEIARNLRALSPDVTTGAKFNEAAQKKANICRGQLGQILKHPLASVFYKELKLDGRSKYGMGSLYNIVENPHKHGGCVDYYGLALLEYVEKYKQLVKHSNAENPLTKYLKNINKTRSVERTLLPSELDNNSQYFSKRLKEQYPYISNNSSPDYIITNESPVCTTTTTTTTTISSNTSNLFFSTTSSSNNSSDQYISFSDSDSSEDELISIARY